MITSLFPGKFATPLCISNVLEQPFTFAYSCQLDIRFLGLVFDLLYSLLYSCLEGICLEDSEKITLQGGKSNIFYQVLSGFLLLAEN